ncbi:hypothetical protein EV426DRAFT_572384 [Tirmania nivea]|nr:hypothetical protein EV426DRAFT_572384 [Tirmania nivea]
MHSATADYHLGHCSGTSICYTSHPPISEPLVPLLPKVDPHQPVKQKIQESPKAPNKHQPNLASITGNVPPAESTPKRRQGRKRKTTSLPDTLPQEVSSSVSQNLRPAKRPTLAPKQPNPISLSSSSSSNANLFGFPADPETHRASSIQPTIALLRPSLGEGYEGSRYIPTGNLLSGSNPMNGDIQASNNSVGGEAASFDLTPYSLGLFSPVNYPSQNCDDGHAGARVSTPNAQGLGISSGEQSPIQLWAGSTGPPSVTCPWYSHLERIVTLTVAISRMSRKLKSTTVQPLCAVDVEVLLEQSENLLLSYFKLKESSMGSSEGQRFR